LALENGIAWHWSRASLGAGMGAVWGRIYNLWRRSGRCTAVGVGAGIGTGQRIGADADVRALLGVLKADGAPKTFLTKTSNFAPGVTQNLASQTIPWSETRVG